KQQKFEKESSIVVDRQRLEQAKTIDWMAFSAEKTLAIYNKEISQCLSNGGQIRLLLINPQGDLPAILARLGYTRRPETIATSVNETLDLLTHWSISIPGCKLELRYLPGQPPYRLMVVNHSLPTGYIRLRLYVTPGLEDAPTVALRATEDSEWFAFLRE